MKRVPVAYYQEVRRQDQPRRSSHVPKGTTEGHSWAIASGRAGGAEAMVPDYPAFVGPRSMWSCSAQALVEVTAVPGFLAELAEEGEPSGTGEPAQYHRYPEKEKARLPFMRGMSIITAGIAIQVT
ncbi:MAG: hypothetical protein IPJ85_07330 [Flavobacteriales bacterium]|nr:hypothetical protein [Flavobacteriales bacterium]